MTRRVLTDSLATANSSSLNAVSSSLAFRTRKVTSIEDGRVTVTSSDCPGRAVSEKSRGSANPGAETFTPISKPWRAGGISIERGLVPESERDGIFVAKPSALAKRPRPRWRFVAGRGSNSTSPWRPGSPASSATCRVTRRDRPASRQRGPWQFRGQSKN